MHLGNTGSEEVNTESEEVNIESKEVNVGRVGPKNALHGHSPQRKLKCSVAFAKTHLKTFLQAFVSLARRSIQSIKQHSLELMKNMTSSHIKQE